MCEVDNLRNYLCRSQVYPMEFRPYLAASWSFSSPNASSPWLFATVVAQQLAVPAAVCVCVCVVCVVCLYSVCVYDTIGLDTSCNEHVRSTAPSTK